MNGKVESAFIVLFLEDESDDGRKCLEESTKESINSYFKRGNATYGFKMVLDEGSILKRLTPIEMVLSARNFIAKYKLGLELNQFNELRSVNPPENSEDVTMYYLKWNTKRVTLEEWQCSYSGNDKYEKTLASVELSDVIKVFKWCYDRTIIKFNLDALVSLSTHMIGELANQVNHFFILNRDDARRVNLGVNANTDLTTAPSV